jgi:proteasome lid subunit RPN8/RPN11
MMQVTLKSVLQERIFQQMETHYPNECGGFLLGTINGDSIEIEDTVQIENVFEAEEQYHRYAMTPHDWARLEDEADERGLVLVGYYHSHPDSPAIPSVYDRDHALPNFTYIITSVEKGKAVDMRVWRLRGDRSQFDPDELAISN